MVRYTSYHRGFRLVDNNEEDDDEFEDDERPEAWVVIAA